MTSRAWVSFLTVTRKKKTLRDCMNTDRGDLAFLRRCLFISRLQPAFLIAQPWASPPRLVGAAQFNWQPRRCRAKR